MISHAELTDATVMTWVIGANPPFGGYGALLSDVQVTFEDGRRLDLLRKIYPVGRGIAAGFAGSVTLGFQLLDSLSQYLKLPDDAPEGAMWADPTAMLHDWFETGLRIFSTSPDRERRHGSRLLLSVVHPTIDLMADRARAYLVRFTFPEGEVGSSGKSNRVLSIGTGSTVIDYRRAIRLMFRPESGLMQAEMGALGEQGGWSQAMAYGIYMAMRDSPRAGISPHMHILRTYRNGFALSTNDLRLYPKETPPVEFTMPPVAHSLEEFLGMAERANADAATASA